MRFLPSRAPRFDTGPNMTPLVDIVMVILIFLMLAGSFAFSERVVKSEMPPGGPSPNLPATVTPGLQFDLYVNAPDNGHFIASATSFGNVTDLDVLKVKLAEQAARYKAGGVALETVTVVIHSTAQSLWEPVLGSYEAALQAKFTKVAFAWAR